MDLTKVTAVFFGSRASEFRKKHIDTINQLCNSSISGYAFRDVPSLQTLLEITLQLVSDGLMDFTAPACSLIEVLSKPYRLQSATDELRLTGLLKGVLTAVGRALEEPFPWQIQACCAQMLTEFASVYGGQKAGGVDAASSGPADLLSPDTTWSLHQSIIQETSVPTKLAMALHAAQLAPEDNAAAAAALKSALATAALQLTASPGSCQQLAAAGALVPLLGLLADATQRSCWPLITEAAWNVMELHPASRQLPAVDLAIRAAANAFTQPARSNDAPLAASSSTAANSCCAITLPSTTSRSQVQAGSSTSTTVSPKQDLPLSAQASSSSHSAAPRPLQATLPESASATSTTASRASTLCVQYSSKQQARHIASAICPLYSRLASPSASQSDQELANDLLVLLGYLAAGSAEAAAALHEQGFAEVVLQQAAALAGGQQGGLLHQTAASVATLRVFAPKRDEAACQRLQLLWGVLAGAAVLDSAWQQEVATSSAIPTLIQYASWTYGAQGSTPGFSTAAAAALPGSMSTAGGSSSPRLRWSADQSNGLRGHALSMLHKLASCCGAEMLSADAVPHLLGLAASRQAGPGHSEAAVQVVAMLARALPQLQLGCAEQGAVSELLRLAADLESQPDSVRRAALVCLAQVCQDNTQATRLLRHAGGAEALAAQLRNTQLAESSQPQLLLAAVASALQAAVLPGAKSCARLLVAGGMQALLDLLAAGNRLQRPLLLSLLSDLLQQPAAADYFHEWRAGPAASGRNAVQLVLEIWREQEHVDGLTQGGVLVSTTNPLQLPDINFEPEGPTGASPGPDMSAGGPEPAAGTGGLARQHGTAASTLVMASAPYSALQPARMQELALFVEAAAGRALMHRTRAVLELAGWQRCLAAAPSAEDQCCLALAEQYVRLLQGHVWASLERGYTQQGIRPTTPDRQRLESGRLRSEALAAAVQQQQRDVVARQRRELASAEGRFYTSLGQQHAMDAAARHYQPDRSQLSVKERVAAKGRRDNMLAASMRGAAAGALGAGGGSGGSQLGRQGDGGSGGGAGLPSVPASRTSSGLGGTRLGSGAGQGRESSSARSSTSAS